MNLHRRIRITAAGFGRTLRLFGQGPISPNIIRRRYKKSIQMSPGQVHAILNAIALAGPKCKLLVFGCGNDTRLWLEANRSGKTVFLESHPDWLAEVSRRNPTADIRRIEYPADLTVSNSLPIDEQRLSTYPVPAVMTEEAWDVIIVDAPQGFNGKAPGRALPIYWSSKVAGPQTQIYVDDYERALEREYAERFLNGRRKWYATIPRLEKHGRSSVGLMLWSMGTGLEVSTSAVAISRAQVPARRGRGAVIFLLDSAYLPGLKVLAYSLRHAIAANTHDILILTNDPRVAQDDTVKRLATNIQVFSDEDIARIKTVDSSRVKPRFRHSELGKYTFLKFLSFADFGYDHHIFLDVDMICLDPGFRFGDLTGNFDFAAAPTLGKRFFQDVTDPQIALEKVQRADSRKHGINRSMNSGVFFASSSVLGQDSVSRLITIGRESASRLEQQITLAFIQQTPDIRFCSLPIRYNFVELAARLVGPQGFRTVSPVFLHYNSPRKPWQSGSPTDWVAQLWHEQSAAAGGWEPYQPE